MAASERIVCEACDGILVGMGGISPHPAVLLVDHHTPHGHTSLSPCELRQARAHAQGVESSP